jgi:hypothetical protein
VIMVTSFALDRAVPARFPPTPRHPPPSGSPLSTSCASSRPSLRLPSAQSLSFQVSSFRSPPSPVSFHFHFHSSLSPLRSPLSALRFHPSSFILHPSSFPPPSAPLRALCVLRALCGFTSPTSCASSRPSLRPQLSGFKFPVSSFPCLLPLSLSLLTLPAFRSPLSGFILHPSSFILPRPPPPSAPLRALCVLRALCGFISSPHVTRHLPPVTRHPSPATRHKSLPPIACPPPLITIP